MEQKSHKDNGGMYAGVVRSLFAGLDSVIAGNTGIRGKKVSESVYSTESSDSNDAVVSTLSSGLSKQVKAVADELGLTGQLGFESADFNAAAMGGLLAADKGNVTGAFRKPDNAIMVGSTAGNISQKRVISTEAYNEQDITNFQKASIVFSLMAAQQTKWAKLFFPPIAIDPMEVGIMTPVTVQMVFNEYHHATDGSLAVTGRKLIVRGHKNPEILFNDLTRLVPVYREDDEKNKKNFIDPALCAVKPVDLGGGVSVQSNYLATDVEINLIGLAQTNKSLNRGLAGHTRSISPVALLEELVLVFGDEAFAVNVTGLIGHRYLHAQQNLTTRVQLQLESSDVWMAAGSLNLNGALSTKAELKDYDLRVRIFTNGYIDLDTGRSKVTTSTIELHAANDKNGVPVDDATFENIKKVVEEGKASGYKLNARLENLDLAENGLLTESKTYNLVVSIPWRNPVSNTSTTYDNEFDFEGTLAGLVNVHRMQADGDAVKKLHTHFAMLQSYRAVMDKEGNVPMLDSVGTRAGIIPTKQELTINASEIVDGTRSAHRFEDIKGGILGVIHQMAMRLNIDSQFSIVGKTVTGDEDFRPKIIVLCDQLTYSYLSIKFGSTVTHEEYEIEFVETEKESMIGLMYVGLTTASDKQAPGILSPVVFGNYVYSPEMVSNLNRTVDGQTSRYLVATPRYDHVINVDVMGRIKLEGMEKLADKLPIFTKEQK